MNYIKRYDKEEDILQIELLDNVHTQEDRYEEPLPGIRLEFSDGGLLIGIEIMDYIKRGGSKDFIEEEK